MEKDGAVSFVSDLFVEVRKDRVEEQRSVDVSMGSSIDGVVRRRLENLFRNSIFAAVSNCSGDIGIILLAGRGGVRMDRRGEIFEPSLKNVGNSIWLIRLIE